MANAQSRLVDLIEERVSMQKEVLKVVQKAKQAAAGAQEDGSACYLLAARRERLKEPFDATMREVHSLREEEQHSLKLVERKEASAKMLQEQLSQLSDDFRSPSSALAALLSTRGRAALCSPAATLRLDRQRHCRSL